jgi:L-lactate dehydrogenase complex protein LldG
MSSREAILKALRRAAPPPRPLPEEPAAITWPDPVAQFVETANAIGAPAARVPDLAALDGAIQGLEVWKKAEKTVSLVPGAGRSTFEVAAARDPHELEGIDVAVLPGELGVAENGAVWIPGKLLGPHRAIFVIPQHLVLVVPAGAIVNNMQEAYTRMTIERPGFGAWVAGPSKTADIEQALVVGAHGPMTCAVFVLG